MKLNNMFKNSFIKTILLLILFLILILKTPAQEIARDWITDQNDLTGNLSIDSKILFAESKPESLPQIMILQEDKKSPFLAGLLSFVIPGAGEIYAESYLKAGIFVLLEAAVITTAVVYDKKGNDKTVEFENYADENWSVVKYAEWLATFEGANLEEIIISNNQSLPPWERVNWTRLNAAETGSHHLPLHGEQQYYELIGKYHQYSPGWEEFDPANSNKENVPPQMLFYSGMRGKANDYYNIASTAVIGIYINHLLSALDAVWSTAQYNKNLAMKIRFENQNLTGNYSDLTPTLYLKYNF